MADNHRIIQGNTVSSGTTGEAPAASVPTIDTAGRDARDAAPESVIETQNLWRIYKTGQREVPALRGINLQIAGGSFVALKGRSGSGKTTLLNALGGLDRPTSGMIKMFGADIAKLSEKQLTRWRRERVGFIFQSFGLLPTNSAYENVDLVLRIAGMGGRQRHERTMYCLNLVGLGKWIHHRPYEMSGGQQQRVAIARALANSPRLILADEATGELDSTTARDILTLFRAIVREEKVTMLLASHDSLVDQYVDYVLTMKDGELVMPNGNGGTN
jgi:putative ABC transport system ATP-binding protein